MKKKLIAILIILLAASYAFSWQKTYTADSPEYVRLTEVARLAGVSIPDMTLPATGDELLTALETIPEERLSDEELSLFLELKHSLLAPPVLYRHDDLGFNADAMLNPLSVYGNLTDDSWTSLDFFVRENRRPHLYDLSAELFVTPYFYGRANINGTKIIGEEDDFMDGKMRYAGVFKLKEMSQDWPDVALGSIGGKYLNLMIGREKVSAGAGHTGNMALSANRAFDDFAKFSVYKSPVAYDFTALFYDGYTADSTSTDLKLRYNDYEGPRKMVFIHRLSSVFARRVTLSLYEGVVVYGSSVLSDLRVLNPFMLFHNSGSYYSGNTNNFAGLEVSAAISHGISANLQMIFDQFQLSDESDESGKTQLGLLAGLTHTALLKGGVATSYIEGVYATDGMYLKEYDNSKNGYNKNGNTFYSYQLDMVSGYKRYADREADEYKYMGYPDGGAIFKIAAGSTYSIGDFRFTADLSYAVKNYYGIGRGEVRMIDGEALSGHGEKEKRLSLSTSAQGKFLNGALEASVGLAGVRYWNYQHVKDEDNSQFQVSLCCKIYPLEFFARRTPLGDGE